MNSKQRSRCIKGRMGNDLKQKILSYNGIITKDQLGTTPSILECSRCELINELENKFCSKCSYPLVPTAFEEVKQNEQITTNELKVKYEDDMSKIRQVLANLVTSVRKCETTQKQHIAEQLIAEQLIAEQLIRSGSYNPVDRLESESSQKDEDWNKNLRSNRGPAPQG